MPPPPDMYLKEVKQVPYKSIASTGIAMTPIILVIMIVFIFFMFYSAKE